MRRKNCWEARACGRQPGGDNVEALGVCPAAMANKFDGINQGERGGRFCWAVVGTFCSGRVQGTFAMKFLACMRCEFLQQVQEEEGRSFVLSPRDAKGVLQEKA